MNIPSYLKLINRRYALVCALALSACATKTDTALSPEGALQKPTGYTHAADFYYTVEYGNTLTNIALRFTGNEDNWIAIANANGVTDPNKLRVGQQIMVPGHLLPPTVKKAHATSIPTSIAVRSLDQNTVWSTPNVIDDIGPDAANVELKKANPNKRFVLRPLGSDINSAAADPVGNEYITIIGSYFPKVVYQSPQPDAKLLMRVTPGATFPLEKLDDGWYQISTDKGPGYLRLQDGKPTNSKT